MSTSIAMGLPALLALAAVASTFNGDVGANVAAERTDAAISSTDDIGDAIISSCGAGEGVDALRLRPTTGVRFGGMNAAESR